MKAGYINIEALTWIRRNFTSVYRKDDFHWISRRESDRDWDGIKSECLKLYSDDEVLDIFNDLSHPLRKEISDFVKCKTMAILYKGAISNELHVFLSSNDQFMKDVKVPIALVKEFRNMKQCHNNTL